MGKALLRAQMPEEWRRSPTGSPTDKAHRLGPRDSSASACTDLANAERLVVLHGGDLRYCYPWRKWLVWDGKRWHVDDTGGVMRLAKKTALPKRPNLIEP